MPPMLQVAVLPLVTTLLAASVLAYAADEATPGAAPATPPMMSTPEQPGPALPSPEGPGQAMPSRPIPGAMGQIPWEGPMGGPRRMAPGPMRGGRMGPMNRQRMQQHWAEMQAHHKAMEARLANIESLLRELVSLQKAGN